MKFSALIVLLLLSLCAAVLEEKHSIKKRHPGSGDSPGDPCCKDGRDGRDGRDGALGPRGPTGHDGEPGSHGVAGRDGRDGVPGPRGVAGRDGKTGPPGMIGPQGPPGPRSGGVTYVRWGRTTCPDTEGTEVVYTGRAAGSHYQHTGGTNDYLCLPDEPEYLQYRAGVQSTSPLYSAEYEVSTGPLSAFHEHNAPCVVCCTSRVSVLMIPARVSCPPTWTLEYCGYLMTAYKGHNRRSAVCVDKDPEAVPGEAADTDGTLFYHTEATCTGILCPPYDPQKELTCAVCTK